MDAEMQERANLFSQGVKRLSKQLGFELQADLQRVDGSNFFRPILKIAPSPNWQPPTPQQETQIGEELNPALENPS